MGLILYGGGIPPSWSDDADFLVLIPTRSTEIVQRTLQVVEAALDSQADSYMPFMSDPEGNQALSAILKATNMEFIGASPEKYRTILNRVGVRWAATDLGLEVVPTSEMIEDRADALYWLTRIPCPVVVRTLRSKSRRFFSQDDAMNYIDSVISDGPLVIEQLVTDAIEVETIMFGQPGDMPICLGEIDMTKRGAARRNLTELPPDTLSEEWLMRVRRNAALLIMKLEWKGLISARFLITRDHRAYFLQLHPGFQPWHQLVEHAIGADIIDGQVRMLHGEELDWEQTEIRFKGHRIGLHIIALSSGVVTTRDATIPNKCDILWNITSGDSVQSGQSLAYVICGGASRQEAIVRGQNILATLDIIGPKTNIGDLQSEFLKTSYWTAPTPRHLERSQPANET